jgi:predicted AAA+ superfamily ATPase
MKNPRYIEKWIAEFCFPVGKMAFVSGPRQCGKTTMAKHLLAQRRDNGAYYNWDETIFRRLWAKDPAQALFFNKMTAKPLVIFDELHKAKLWKRNLKGLYDTQHENYDFLITGSARLNIYRKGSDSLMGRYYHFRLHPFSVAELYSKEILDEPENLLDLELINHKPSIQAEKALNKLYDFGPFPEPLFGDDKRILNLWRRNRVEKIVREDLRDLSRLPELSQVEMLVSLLPEKIAQPLSIRSLSEDLEVSYTTIKRWMNYLNELYYFFELKPYSKSLTRSIKKEKKIYLWDWTEVENLGARFENLIAAHLLKYCDYLTDTGAGDYELCYLRDKEKNEIDFLIVKDKKPFLPIEAKLNDVEPSKNWVKWLKQLGGSVGIQLVMKKNVYKIHRQENYSILVISAAQWLKYLI